jgi:beta-glucanase (GH16 family)
MLIAFYIILQKPPVKQYNINIIKEPHDLILVDDFAGFKGAYWNIVEQGNNYNNELQYYKSDNILYKNGTLVITADKENYKDYTYTSGLITTQGKFEFLYGKIIFKAKPAPGKGLLSAVWLLPKDGSLYPEIDIIEVLGEKPSEIWMGVHYLDNQQLKSNFQTFIQKDNSFAIYELHWEKNELRWYVNGELVHRNNKNSPHQEMYLLINLAIGGNWPKKPDDNIFPSSFLVDYIIIIPENRTL